MTEKCCTKCGLTKHDVDFPVTTARGKRVVRSWCRACCNSYYRKKNREKVGQEKRLATHRDKLAAVRDRGRVKTATELGL